MKRNQRRNNDEHKRRIELALQEFAEDGIDSDINIDMLVSDVDDVGIKIREYLAHDAADGYVDPAPRYLH